MTVAPVEKDTEMAEGAAAVPPSCGLLASNAIGPLGLAAMVVGVTSPAIGLYVLWAPMEAAAGPVAPLVFLGVLAITLPTAFSYAVLNRHAPSAGAASAWLWTTIGPTAGLLAGLVMATYFIMGAITVPLLFGLFLRDLLALIRIPVPALPTVAAGVILQSALVARISLGKVEVSVKTMMRLTLVEIGVVLALSATILWVKAGQPGGPDLGPFEPSHATRGLPGMWAAITLGMMAFSGFDVITASTEEAKAPREHVPRALILGLVAVGLFWAANAWVLTLSTPEAKVLEYNARGEAAITAVAATYWGWGSLAVVLTALTGLTAIYIGCVQGASRILFALGRHGVLPAPFAELHRPSRTPRVAVAFVVTACAVLALLSLALLGSGLDSFVWWTNAMVFFAALTYTGVNLANLLYFWRVAPDSFDFARNVVVPVAGVALNLILIYEAFFSALWSAPFRAGQSVVIGCLILFAMQCGGVLWARVFRRRLLTQQAPLGVGSA
jgi:amino acid transporter